MAVAIAAPFIPYIGIKIILRIIFRIVVTMKFIKISLDLPVIKIRSLGRVVKWNRNPPIASILKAV